MTDEPLILVGALAETAHSHAVNQLSADCNVWVRFRGNREAYAVAIRELADKIRREGCPKCGRHFE